MGIGLTIAVVLVLGTVIYKVTRFIQHQNQGQSNTPPQQPTPAATAPATAPTAPATATPAPAPATPKKSKSGSILVVISILLVLLVVGFVVKKAIDFYIYSKRMEWTTVAQSAPVQHHEPKDTTFHITVTDEWSKPITTLADECVHFTRQDSVAYEERYDDGSILFVPKKIEPGKTTTKIVDAHGKVIENLTADKYGRFSILGRRGRQIRVFGAKMATFEVRLNSI